MGKGGCTTGPVEKLEKGHKFILFGHDITTTGNLRRQMACCCNTDGLDKENAKLTKMRVEAVGPFSISLLRKPKAGCVKL